MFRPALWDSFCEMMLLWELLSSLCGFRSEGYLLAAEGATGQVTLQPTGGYPQWMLTPFRRELGTILPVAFGIRGISQDSVESSLSFLSD